MQLVEQGKMRLDDPINQYLGDSQVQDQSEKPVTFTHILSHWSGLKGGAETQPIWGRKLPKTLEEMTSALHSVRRARDEVGIQQLRLRDGGPSGAEDLRRRVREVHASTTC